MAKEWYILHTYTGHERKVEKRIQMLLDNNELDAVSDVVVPAEQFSEVRGGKKRSKVRVFLPGYILMEIDFDRQDWQKTCALLCGLDSVTGFVGTPRGARPTPIDTEEARHILHRVGEIKGGATQDVQHAFTEGESVRIMEGPFESFTGSIDLIDTEKGKLRVLVGIFGRVTPVEVGVMEVEKI